MKIEEKGDQLVVVDFDEFDAFRIACKIEKDGMEFYGQLSSATNKREVKNALSFLMEEEEKHLKFFEDALQQLRDKKEDAGEEDDLLTTMDYGIFSAYPTLSEFDAILNDTPKALRLGIAIESKSINFYQVCRDKVSRASAKKEIKRIIGEEKRHKALFEELLDAIKE